MASPSDRAGSEASTTSVKESELTFDLSSPSDPAADEVTLAPQVDASSQTAPEREDIENLGGELMSGAFHLHLRQVLR